MKREDLSNAVGNISTRHIQEAESYGPLKSSFNHKKFSTKKLIALVATLVLCFAIAVPVLAAADVQAAYELLYAISPETAQGLKQVRMSCEDEGIRMEVVSASIRDNVAQIYITMQDMAGNRIDETTDLFDSYSINQPFSGSSTCQFIDYDAETKTAEFMIFITNSDQKNIIGKKITFSVDKFLSNKQEYNDILLPQIDLGDVQLSPQTQTKVKVRGSLGEYNSTKKSHFLMPDAQKTFSPVNGVTITGLGFINGKLHIQAYYENILETDNHGYLDLVDADGDKIAPQGSISFWDTERRGSYEEYIFDVSPDEISNYKVLGNFRTCESLTSGDWQVTFPIE